MDAIHGIMRVVTRILEIFVTLCFFVILAMTVILVVLRYVFNSSIMGGNELIEYLFIYTSAIGAAAALARREHISITFLIDRLPRLGRRIVDAVGFLLVALFNAAVIVYSAPWIRAAGGFESPVLRLPNRTIQLIVPIGSGLAILFCLCHMLLTLGGRTKPEEGTAG